MEDTIITSISSQDYPITVNTLGTLVPPHLTISDSDDRPSAQLNDLIAEAENIPDLEKICGGDRALKNFVVRGVKRINRSRYLLFKEFYRLGRFIDGLKNKKKISDEHFNKISLILREDAGISKGEQKAALKLYEKLEALSEAKRRQLTGIDKPIWNLTLFNKLCQLSEPKWAQFSESLTKLKRRANFGHSALKDLIESLIPPKYLKLGQPFKDIDRELIATKLKRTPEVVATIVEAAGALAANREDPTLQTDDVIAALSEAGYDTSGILAPPPKPTKREAEVLATLEKAELERADALALVERLQQKIKELQKQIDSSTMNVETSLIQPTGEEATTKSTSIEAGSSSNLNKAIIKDEEFASLLVPQATGESEVICAFRAADQIQAQQMPDLVDTLALHDPVALLVVPTDAQQLKEQTSDLESAGTLLPTAITAVANKEPEALDSSSPSSEKAEALVEENLQLSDADGERLTNSQPIQQQETNFLQVVSVVETANKQQQLLNVRPVQRFAKDAKILIFDEDKGQIVNRGKMVKQVDKQILVRHNDGTSHLYEKSLLRIQVPEKLSSSNKPKKGFAD